MSRALLLTGAFAGVLLVLFGASDLRADDWPVWLASAVLGLILVWLVWYDLTSYRLPDWLTLPLIVLGLIVTWSEARSLLLAAVGAGTGYGLIWGLNIWWRKTRGRDGIGMGDAKLLAAAGSWLGVTALPGVLLVASGLGLAMALPMTVRGQTDQALPFGPCLALGMWSTWCLRPVMFMPL